MAIDFEKFVLWSNLTSIAFERSAFRVMERFSEKRAGAMEIVTPLELQIENTDEGVKRLVAILDGGMKGYVYPDQADRQEQVEFTEQDMIVSAEFLVKAVFDFGAREVANSEFEVLMSEKGNAIGRFLLLQIYPYVRDHLRIRLVESGFKGLEPPVTVLGDGEGLDLEKSVDA